MANANPGVTLNGVSAAGAGSAIDMMGAATGVAGIRRISLIGSASTLSVAAAVASVGIPFIAIGLEVSLDNSVWVRIAVAQVANTGPFMVSGECPCRYARAVIDPLDSRISSISVTASVCGA